MKGEGNREVDTHCFYSPLVTRHSQLYELYTLKQLLTTIMSLSRDTILNTLRSVLEPLDSVHAMWEGGAAAFGRVDDWSDIDLQILCDDDAVEDVFRLTEQTIQTLSPIELKYEIPQPSWHGHAQAFYRIADAGPFLLLDFVVMKKGGTSGRFLEREIHGKSFVHFNKNESIREEHIDVSEFARKLERRINDMRLTFELFQPMVLKELHRGNSVEAIQYYNGMTLRPLLELLRIIHAPSRYNFHTRYFYYDLPADVIQRLEPFFFIVDADDLGKKFHQAGEWFKELIASVDMEDVRGKLENGG